MEDRTLKFYSMYNLSLLSIINIEVAGNAPFEHNQALEDNNHQNNDNQVDIIGPQNLQIDHQEPLPPDNDDQRELIPDFEDFYNRLQQNDGDDNELLYEFQRHQYPGFDNQDQNLHLNFDNNIFEIPIRRNHDSDDEDGELPDQNNDDDNHPLYLGAGISKRESMLVILAMSLKHHLSMTCIEDLIRVVELHCLRQELIKNSLHKFQKYFNFDKETVKKHFYCPSCANQLNNVNDLCLMCPQTKSSFFLELPITNHLKEMYKREYFYNSLHNKFDRPIFDDKIADIYDGELYKSWINNGFLSNWYIDGVPVFKSSKVGAWPIYFTINELPFEERKKITILYC
ncbi:uncharacterized protein LOC130672919 [Microplitis mediator]|uniref:uncharacterized protein LOC130672919 n=1 Tax=Microplitis mediator TaxID=375433 RepID=UPI0025553331|nr:uncharacterized protein LOC130672919 [Microplitis mediator]